MRTGPGVLASALLVGLLAAPALAGGICQDSDTVEECDEKVRKEFGPEKTAELMPEQPVILNEALAKTAAGRLLEKAAPEIAALPGAAGTFEDLLSLFRVGVETVDLDGDGEEAIALELTNFLGLDTRQGYKVQALLLGADVFEPLGKLLSADDLTSRKKSLDDFDNVLLRAVYSPSSDRIGRDLVFFQDQLSLLLQQAKTALPDTGAAENYFISQLEALAARHEGLIDEGTGHFAGRFEDIPDAKLRKSYRDAYEALQAAEWKRTALLAWNLESKNYFQVVDLVANQPQLNVTGSATLRDDLVGPKEYAAKVTYEHGFVSFNKYRGYRTDHCQEKDPLTCLAAYLTPARQASLKKGDRVSFSVEWTKLDSYESPIEGVTLSREGSERWSGAFSYGRFIRFDKDGNGVARFEATLEGQDWSDDPDRQNRLLGRLSLSQKISDDVSATIGLVWANKPEFFPDEDFDKEWSARVGLSYRLVSTKKDE